MDETRFVQILNSEDKIDEQTYKRLSKYVKSNCLVVLHGGCPHAGYNDMLKLFKLVKPTEENRSHFEELIKLTLARISETLKESIIDNDNFDTIVEKFRSFAEQTLPKDTILINLDI